MALSLPSCGEEDVEEFVSFIESLPDGTEIFPAIAERYQLPPPSFRLRLVNASDTALPPGVQAATTHLEEVQLVFKRPDDLAEELLIPDTGTEPLRVDLLALDAEQGQEIVADQLPDGEVSEVRLIFTRGTMRMADRELSLGFTRGPHVGVRLTLRRPWRINEDVPNNFNLLFDVSRSFVHDDNNGFLLEPVIRVPGDQAPGVHEMEAAIGIPTVFPVAVQENLPTEVTAYVRVTDPSVDLASLRLVRVLPDGSTSVVGSLNDTGTSGDEEADDTFHTAVVTLNEPAGETFLRVEGLGLGGLPLRSLTSRVEIAGAGVPLGPAGRHPAEELGGVEDDISGGRVSPRRLVVQISPRTPFSDIQDIAAAAGGSVIGRIPELDTWQVEIPGDGTSDEVWAAAVLLALADPRVERVAPEIYSTASGVTANDPDLQALNPPLTKQRHIFDLSVPSAWAFSRGSVKTGVVNTGAERQHPDLVARVQLGRNWIRGGSGSAHDDDGHGTSVAGIIGAETDNGNQVAGITWFRHVFATKSLNQNGNGNSAELAAGILDAVRHGAWVINMSLGSSPGTAGAFRASAHRSAQIRRVARRVAARAAAQVRRAARAVSRAFRRAFRQLGNWTESRAINYAHTRNRLTVAAAGNESSTGHVSPGRYVDLEVAANDPPATVPVIGRSQPNRVILAGFSNRGTTVDVCALGGHDSTGAGVVGTTALGGGTRAFDGTSAAAPIVTGIAALFWSHDRKLHRVTVRGAVREGARDGGSEVGVSATGSPFPFRNVDASETFNYAWTRTGLWRNQLDPQTVTVEPGHQTYVDRSAWMLPPGTSPGLPDPNLIPVPGFPSPGRSVWWFGSPLHGTYVDFQLAPGQTPLGGGFSPGIMSGVIRTPPITFQNSPDPVLQFKTWWEIESQGADAFDLMEIFAVGPAGTTPVHLVTLNPAATALGATRAPGIGHSSGGFNVAPAWVRTRVQLRTASSSTLFGGAPYVIEVRFDSVDGLYNAFLGWVVDEVRILDGTALPGGLTGIPFAAMNPATRRITH